MNYHNTQLLTAEEGYGSIALLLAGSSQQGLPALGDLALFSCQGHILNTQGLECVLLTFLSSLIFVASRVTYLDTDLGSKAQSVHLGPSKESKQTWSVSKRQILSSDSLSAFPLS